MVVEPITYQAAMEFQKNIRRKFFSFEWIGMEHL